MKGLFRKAYAFLQRDFRIESGYKVSFLSRIFDSVVLIAFFFFLNKLIASRGTGFLSAYGGQYFPFAIIGLACARYFDLTQRMFSDSVRLAQVTGCLDAMLSSQTGGVTIALMSSLYGLISGAVQLIIIFLAGVVIFGLDLSHMNISATLLVLLVSIATFVAFGILSAATVVWLKKGDPITWVFGSVGGLLGGAYFPIAVMPGWMQKLSFFIPITYSLDALRLTMLRGYSLNMVTKPVVTLSIMAVILLPISFVVFAAAVRTGRRDGTLMQY